MMQRIKTYKMFEAESGNGVLTPEQIEWLNKCSGGSESWTLNPETGLVDVMSNFDCSSQNLTDFKGVRFGQIVGDFTFNCSHNQLSSLEGAPESVGGDFFCKNNQITSLKGAPQSIGGYFGSHDNPVSESVLSEIYSEMKSGESYQETLQKLWDKFPMEDQALLYRPEFKWVSDDDAKKLKAFANYKRIEGMI